MNVFLPFNDRKNAGQSRLLNKQALQFTFSPHMVNIDITATTQALYSETDKIQMETLLAEAEAPLPDKIDP